MLFALNFLKIFKYKGDIWTYFGWHDCSVDKEYIRGKTILVAKTSFGKRLFMQILPCLVPRSTILIILPLLSLGFEQEEKIRRLGHTVRPIFVHGDNVNSPNLLRDIKEGSIRTFYPH